MKIEDIRAYKCFAGWRNWVFVEVETDTGLVGTGEATLEGRELSIEGNLEDLSRYLLGRNPLHINEHRLKLKRDPFWTNGFVAMTGLAAVEIALWDILGKSLKAPVWQLLGGKVRDRMRVYANGWYFGAQTTEDWVSRAGEVAELGYTALKFDPFGTAGPTISREQLEVAVEIVEGLRTLSNRLELMIEGHGRFDTLSAMRVAQALSPFDCYWFEEPLHPGNETVQADFARRSPIPVALGERLHSVIDYVRLFQTQGVSVVQPDVLHAGGILETIQIASMAEAQSVVVAPHNPNGPVATAATLAVDAVIPNFLVQEMLAPWDVSWRHQVVDHSPQVVDGYVEPNEGHGLGLALNHEVIEAHPFQPIDPNFYSDESVLDKVDLSMSPSDNPPHRELFVIRSADR